jgi:hypothetical protein
MMLLTWAKRMEEDFSSPSFAAAMASSSVARVTPAKNACATVILYFVAFAEY